jgi:hypothetical protein
MMATAPTGSTERESREQARAGTSQIVVVDLEEAQSSELIKRLRKGKGKLMNRVERIVNDLVANGTVKSNAQPVVIVVQESWTPAWLSDDDDDEDD